MASRLGLGYAPCIPPYKPPPFPPILDHSLCLPDIPPGEGDMMVNWLWRLNNMAFENGVVPEEWRSAVIVNVVGKIYTGILVTESVE